MKRNQIFYWVFSAMLLALAVVAKVYLGIPISFLGSLVKDINLSPAVIMFAGITMGPLSGGLVGALTDILATVIRPMGAYVPWFTLTNALIGVVPAFFYLGKKSGKYGFIKCLIVSAVEQTVCSAIINNILLINLYSLPMKVALLRAAGCYISAVIYAVILYYTLNRTAEIFSKLEEQNQVK